jgi:microcystin-dependent protein
MAFAYNPVDGLLNTSSFPDKPASNAAARQQFQELFNQVRDYINAQSSNILIPVGSVFMLFHNPPTIPDGYLKLEGQEVSKSTYQSLWNLYGNTYGTASDSNNFKLPDMRGCFARGFDNGRGFDSGREFGKYQVDDNKSHNHNLYGVVQGTGATGGTKMVPAFNQNLNAWSWQTATYMQNASGVGNAGIAENRVKNMTVIFIVKY